MRKKGFDEQAGDLKTALYKPMDEKGHPVPAGFSENT
jgi:hypothetical protein